jgi:hypothetical protein
MAGLGLDERKKRGGGERRCDGRVRQLPLGSTRNRILARAGEPAWARISPLSALAVQHHETRLSFAEHAVIGVRVTQTPANAAAKTRLPARTWRPKFWLYAMDAKRFEPLNRRTAEPQNRRRNTAKCYTTVISTNQFNLIEAGPIAQIGRFSATFPPSGIPL